MGKPNSTDCLTLNVASGQWERGSFSNRPLGDSVHGVISIEEKGVFLVHTNGISSLVYGSDFWVKGPMFANPAVCGSKVSSTSFVTIHMSDANNVLGYSVVSSEAQPEPIDTWPSLLTKRHGPGCGATSTHLIVAGGITEWDEVLTSVEVINIQSKALRRGGELRQARAYFQIIPVGTKHPRLLAIGGVGVESTLASSEWWESEENSWQIATTATLSTGRSSFGAETVSPALVCSEMDLPGHSCPAASNIDQTCVFPSSEPGFLIFSSFQVHTADQNIYLLVVR